MGNLAPICYLEIPAPDVERAASFYSSLFGWTVTPSNLSDDQYWIFSTGDGQLSGGFDSRLLAEDGGVLLYIRVEDIQATLARIEGAGGKVVQGKTSVGGDFGFSALFRDPNGNRLGLWAKS